MVPVLEVVALQKLNVKFIINGPEKILIAA